MGNVFKGQAQSPAWISRVPGFAVSGKLRRLASASIDRTRGRKSQWLNATHQTPTPARPRRQQLLEQLMQIARISALKEMASGIAHELNQPIGAIATFAQTGERMLSRSEPMIDEARDVLHHISDEALKAGHRHSSHSRPARMAQAPPEPTVQLCRRHRGAAAVLELLAERAGATSRNAAYEPGLPPRRNRSPAHSTRDIRHWCRMPSKRRSARARRR